MAAGRIGRGRILAISGIIAVPLSLHLAIVETRHARLALGLWPALLKYGVICAAAGSYWAIYAGMLALFGFSLRPGKEPLVTGIARRIHGDLSTEMRGYTRGVTCAWCGFFCMQLAVSACLLAFAPLIAWSTYVNLLDIPMVIAMFAGEICCRRLLLRNPPRYSLGTILGMISDPAGAGTLAGTPTGTLAHAGPGER